MYIGSIDSFRNSKYNTFMSMSKNSLIIISVGGSLIVPDGIDLNFLSNFKKTILGQIKKGQRFIIICGGGRTARNYQNAAAKITPLTTEDLDWIGIHATRLNAHLIQAVFREESHPQININPREDLDFKEPILVAAGWMPGCSTDYDSVLLAKKFNANKMVNLSNIDWVYDKDPKYNPDAKKIEEINWEEFRELIPKEWTPGLSSPFDPKASKEAQEIELEVAVINGNKLKNLESYLNGQKFIGTRISGSRPKRQNL